MFDGAFPGMRAPVLVASADGVGTKLKSRLHDRRPQHGRPRPRQPLHQRHPRAGRAPALLPRLRGDGRARARRDRRRSSRASRAAAARTGACCSAARPPRCPASTREGEYDVAGFIVGVVDREKVIDGSRIAPGDVVLALPSAGLHTNGYSLARKLFFEVAGYTADTRFDELGETVGRGAARAAPQLPAARSKVCSTRASSKALAHITGGGLAREHPARPARRHGRRNQARLVARAAGLQAHAGDRQRRRRARCTAPSTWASAWSSSARRPTPRRFATTSTAPVNASPSAASSKARAKSNFSRQ